MKAKQTKAEQADALCHRAHVHWENGRYPVALRLLYAAARMGDSIAMHTIGYFHDVGVSGRKNRSLAMLWYKRAWRRGNASAASNIATMYRDGKDYRRAFAWFNKVVAHGNVSTNFEIARVYMDYLDAPEQAVPYLRLVTKATPGIEVSKWEWERARLLLDGLAAQKRHRHKRASRSSRTRVFDTRKLCAGLAAV